MKNCYFLSVAVFLFLVSCSKEEIEDTSTEDVRAGEEVVNSTAFNETNEFLTSKFLPTFTNYYGRDRGTSTNRSSSLASEWVHEYEEDGKLVKSSFFELYPYRILKEVTYQEVVDDHKLKYEITDYSYYGILHSLTESYELEFDNEMNITKIGKGDIFKELNEQGWVTSIEYAPNGSMIYKTGYEYDEQGNVLKYLSYDMSGINYANVDYSYNENGDPLSYHFKNIYGAEIVVNYSYRGDNTLEKLEEEYHKKDGDSGTVVITYTSEERISTKITNRGDGSKEIVTYTTDEIIIESFTDDVLNEVFIYQIEEEGYFKKLHKEYLDGILHKINYYNAEGELEYTEFYDENGNLTDTVYQ